MKGYNNTRTYFNNNRNRRKSTRRNHYNNRKNNNSSFERTFHGSKEFVDSCKERIEASKKRFDRICSEIAKDFKLDLPTQKFSMDLVDQISKESRDELEAIRQKYSSEMYEAFLNTESRFFVDATRLFLPMKKCFMYRDMIIEFDLKRHDYEMGNYNPTEREKEEFDRMYMLELEAAYNLAWYVSVCRDDEMPDYEKIKDTPAGEVFRKLFPESKEINAENSLIELGYNLFSDVRGEFPKCDFEKARKRLFFTPLNTMAMLNGMQAIEYGALDREDSYEYLLNHFLDDTERDDFKKLYRVHGKKDLYKPGMVRLSDEQQRYFDMLTKLTYRFAQYTLHMIYD